MDKYFNVLKDRELTKEEAKNFVAMLKLRTVDEALSFFEGQIANTKNIMIELAKEIHNDFLRMLIIGMGCTAKHLDESLEKLNKVIEENKKGGK